MKRFIRIALAAFLFFAPILLMGISLFADELPELDPNRPIYQSVVPGLFGLGGYYREVRERDPDTLAEAELRDKIARMEADRNREIKDRAHGVRWMRIGVALFVAGGIAFVILKHYHFELIGVAVAIGGLGSVCYGAIVIKVAENSTAIAVTAVASLGVGLAAYFCHGKGVGIRETMARIKKEP